MQDSNNSFTVLSEEDRRLASKVNLISWIMKTSVLIICAMTVHTGNSMDCGIEAHGLFITLIVVMSIDLGLLAIATAAIKKPYWWLSRTYLYFYEVAKWCLRLSIIVCAVIMSFFYFTSVFRCLGYIRGLLLALTVVLDLFSLLYVAHGFCITCAFFLEEPAPPLRINELTKRSRLSKAYVKINEVEDYN
mmetsp:Transcript_28898/g.51557  ORF Transcript_28898/g.51557 Transcript_28898/m.51557 type:complete len:190 (+) Transcript_28898:890-1459(+)